MVPLASPEPHLSAALPLPKVLPPLHRCKHRRPRQLRRRRRHRHALAQPGSASVHSLGGSVGPASWAEERRGAGAGKQVSRRQYGDRADCAGGGRCVSHCLPRIPAVAHFSPDTSSCRLVDNNSSATARLPPSIRPASLPCTLANARPPAVTGHVIRQRHPHIRRQRRHRLHVLSGCDVG